MNSTLNACASQRLNISVTVNGVCANALIDTGSSLCHVSRNFAERNQFLIIPESNEIGLAVKGSMSCSKGFCTALIHLKEREYRNVKLVVLENLLTDVILGQDFLGQHELVKITFEGNKPPLSLGVLKSVKTNITPRLFAHLTTDCTPVVTKSRRQSAVNREFNEETIQKDLRDGVIEPSTSPWRAQVLVTSRGNHRKRMCIDYSETINKFTLLDGWISFTQYARVGE